MASTAVEIKLDEINKLQQKLNAFVLSGGDKTGLLKSLGVTIEGQIMDRIEFTNLNPDNKRWDPWKESTLKYLRRHRPKSSLLHRQYGGLLLETITSQMQGSDTILAGSPMEYAEYLQDGTKKMVARKFLGFGTDDIIELQDAVDDFMKRQVA